MNHFILPGKTGDLGLLTRYGISDMEVLINETMKLVQNRRQFRQRSSVDGEIMTTSTPHGMIGQKNMGFAGEFLATERIPLVAGRVVVTTA